MISLDLYASIDLYRRDLTATILGGSNVSQPTVVYYITIYAIAPTFYIKGRLPSTFYPSSFPIIIIKAIV